VIVTDPEDGAVQLYQTDAPPTLPPWFGSPVSLVAPTLEPVVVPLEPAIFVALEKSSLTGPAARADAANVAPAQQTPARTVRSTHRLARGNLDIYLPLLS
jgi:hypothetical protein